MRGYSAMHGIATNRGFVQDRGLARNLAKLVFAVEAYLSPIRANGSAEVS